MNVDMKVTDIRKIRRENLPFIFIWVTYYAWVIVFSTWWTASPMNDEFYGVSVRNLMHIANLVSSAVFIFALKRDKFVFAARIGAAGIVVFMTVYLVAVEPSVRTGAAIITAVFIGCLNISMLFPFVFTLNNTEKLYSVVGSNLLICFISLLRVAFSGIGKTADLVVSIVLLLTALVQVVFFPKHHCATSAILSDKKHPKMPGNVWAPLILSCAVAILCKGVSIGVLNVAAENSAVPVFVWYYLGGVIACAGYLLIFRFVDRGFLVIGNVLFGAIALGLLMNSLTSMDRHLLIAVSVLLGFGGTAGMITMYYIIGVIGKKYNSSFYIRSSILAVGMFGGVSGVILGNYISGSNTSKISLIFSIAASGIIILMLSLIPYSSRLHKDQSWMNDAGKSEVSNGNRAADGPADGDGGIHDFSGYGLSKRETEVCTLLLQSYTLRQISAVLSISYNTVNTYCTSLYRKLGINSRSELFLLFLMKEKDL